MQTVTLEELQNDLERYVRASQQGDIEIHAQGKVMAILTAPRPATIWQEFWQHRERALSRVSITGDWNSMSAVSADRDRQ
jgi:hypothetical protein